MYPVAPTTTSFSPEQLSPGVNMFGVVLRTQGREDGIIGA
jgi:hypothetical protein